MRRFLLPLTLTLTGLALAAFAYSHEQQKVTADLLSNPDSNAAIHRLRPLVLASLCLLPAIGSWTYASASTLARYITRQFLVILGITFGGLITIWILADLNDNLSDFKESGRTLELCLRLYSTRLPEMVVMLMPYSLLLSLLYCLGTLSRSREIVAMIQTGRSLVRLTLPFIITGILASILLAGLNFHWAPRSSSAERKLVDEAKKRPSSESRPTRFRNTEARRLWVISSASPGYQLGEPLREVFVVQENPDGSLQSILTASEARWIPRTRDWSFSNPRRMIPQAGQPERYEPNLPNPLVIHGWNETPTQVVLPGVPAPELGIPDLQGWLDTHPEGSWARRSAHLTQWHHRFAQPVNCLIVILLAAPLGVVFSRRATSGGVVVAVILSAAMLFTTTVSLSFGDSGYIPPILAAWLPNALFGLIAIFLFHRRISGRPIYQSLRKLFPFSS